MSLVDYGHRSVPNVFLGAPLETINTKTGTGPWNAAHFNNSQYDKLVAQYVAAADLSTPAQPRRADRDAAAEPDADHLRVLLQLPDGDGEERHRCLPDRDRASVPVQRGEELAPCARCRRAVGGAPASGQRCCRAVSWRWHGACARRGKAARMATEKRARAEPTGTTAATTTGTCPAAGCARPCSAPWTGWYQRVADLRGRRRRRERAHDRADRPGRAGRGRLLDGGRGVRLGLLAERAHLRRGQQGTARAREQRRRRAGRAGHHAPGPRRQRRPPRGRPPRRSRRTRRRRWPCTRWKS